MKQNGIVAFSLLVAALTTSSISIAAPQDFWPNRAVMFVSVGQEKEMTKYAKRNIGQNVPLDIYVVDEGAKIMKSYSDSMPKDVLKQTPQEIDAYIKANIAPKMKNDTSVLMESKLGLSIASMYGVKKVPAVIFDGQYIVYGLKMNEAIKKYQIHKDRVVNGQ